MNSPMNTAATPAPSSRRSQRGLVLIFVLVALLILGIGAVALIRAFDTATLNSANLGFKRDLANEAQLAIVQAKTCFSTGALSSTTAQQSNNPGCNYYSTILDTDTHGIPKILLTTTPAVSKLNSSALLSEVTVYYVIDRLCFAGTIASASKACTYAQSSSDKGGTSGMLKAGAGSLQVFRISVRVDGPHNTRTFVQQTVASAV